MPTFNVHCIARVVIQSVEADSADDAMEKVDEKAATDLIPNGEFYYVESVESDEAFDLDDTGQVF